MNRQGRSVAKALVPCMVVALLYTALAARPADARGSFRVCNKTTVSVSLAVACYSFDADFFVSQGWWNLKPGACVAVFPDNSEDAHRYYYAESSSGVWGDANGLSVCIDPQHRFTIAHADQFSSCPSPYVRKPFRRFGDRDLNLAL